MDENNKLTNFALNNIRQGSIGKKITQEKRTRNLEEIEKIIEEIPLKKDKPKDKPIKKKRKLPKFFSNNILKYCAIGLMIIILLFLLLPSDCNCPEVTNKTVTSVKGAISFDLIKEQIISQGYAQITDGDSIIKLTPYLE